VKSPVVQKISIKSMNQKIRRVGERFGIDSLQYKQLTADIERDFRGLTHTTKKGFIQVSQSKTLKLNEYQIRTVNKIAARQGVKEIVAKAKERIGKKNPTKEEIDENVKKFNELQEKFDKTLDLIYEHEIAGDLPTDINSRYRKIYRSGNGKGMGVTTNDVEFLEDAIVEFDNLRNELDDINSDVKEIIHSKGGSIPDEFANDVYNIETGQMSFDDVKATIDKMRDYRDKLQVSFDPLQIKYTE
jgi:predicted DNA-binding protein YlxM (UPF0122 family)